jgi:hypothetical protein
MKEQKMINEIKKMDRTSDEFAELFHVVNDMYFTFDTPDAFQSSAIVLNLILHKGEDWMVEMLANMVNQMHECIEKDIRATHGKFNISGKDLFFDLYQNKEALSSVHKMFRNTILRSKP